MHLLLCIFCFLAGGAAGFLILWGSLTRKKVELQAMSARLGENDRLKSEAEAGRIAAAKAVATLEAQERQALQERQMVQEAHRTELQNLQEHHEKELQNLRERFQEELAGKLKVGEEQRLAREKIFETERKALQDTIAHLEQSSREDRNELEKNHEKELQNLQERFRNELSDKLKIGEEQKLAQAAAFETERKAMGETFERLEQQSRETKNEMEKNWQTKINLLKEEFKTLSAQILKEKSGDLAAANQTQLSALLKPLQEKLGDFKTAVDQAKEKGISLNSELKEQISHLLTAAKRIGDDANNLASALKGNNKTQGNWGEMILEEILANSGLKKGVHYESQVTLRNEEGSLIQHEESNRFLRPDVIVHYPDGKDVIIDSKVSLSAYTDYMNAETDEERKNALARHNRSIRSHVEELVRKNYSSYLRKAQHETVDFVIMFIPNEASHQLAMIQDPGLWRWAFERKVMIVSPVNLMALLQLIQIAWTRADQERNQQKILDTASSLLDRLYAFYEQFDEVGKKLDSARDAYQKSLDKLKGGNGKHSVVLSGEQLKRLGVKMKRVRPLPARYQDNEVLQLEEESSSTPAGSGGPQTPDTALPPAPPPAG